MSKGQAITQIQADAYLKADCSSAEKAVNSFDHIYHWNQNQFDALVSFTFNCGRGNLNKLLQNGTRTIREICAMIPAYNKAGGVVLQGLVNRRAAEKELFDKPVSSSAPSAVIRKPVSYLQTDPRWKNCNYSAKGEARTIGSSGCGPTAAAMVIATLKDSRVTPVTTAEWSMAHGYKALNQGTYYTYFEPQFAVYDIPCKRLNQTNLYGKTSCDAHTKARNALQKGDWIIACMGKGHWTSSGHFILIYKYEDGMIHINDPASTSESRIKNTWDLFAGQVKYLWTVTVPEEFIPSAPTSPDGISETNVEFIGKINTRSDNLNIRSAPDTASPKTGFYKKGELVPIAAKTSGGWYRTDQGYIYGKYVIAARGRVCGCTKLNMRKQPEVQPDNVTSVLNVNDELYLINRAGNGWYKVRTKNNLAGYVSGKYIAIL